MNAKGNEKGLIIGLLAFSILAQVDEPKNWSLTGYVKNTPTLLFFNDAYQT